jgi:DNA-binding GntR family transcriptional regulator
MYKEIRDRICLLTYPPGTVLREADFANEFGVSRTPVRQVLQRLQFEGLVEAKNGVGTIVTGVQLSTFKDAY